jgi:dipeptidyl aminopeptidase/acylaminoacyl peptidase
MSESAVKTDAFREPELIRWKSFDGKLISGFLYAPPAKFTGKRPVLIEIHGGPEGQSRPDFLGRANYYLTSLASPRWCRMSVVPLDTGRPSRS